MDIVAIQECTKLNLEGKIGFGENVKRLLSAGGIWYLVDLVELKKTTYSTIDAFIEDLLLTNPGKPGDKFNQSSISDILSAVQRKEIDFQEFLRRMIRAGCSYYIIFMKGRKMLYGGNLGDRFESEFPDSLVKFLEN